MGESHDGCPGVTAGEPDRRHAAALTVEVIGRPGDGLRVLARALRVCFGVCAAVPGDDPAVRARAELTVQVLGAQVRAADRELAAVQRRPVIVVAGKADLRRDAARAAELAARAAADLGRPVHPVSGLLAAAVIDAELLAVLRRWRAAGVAVPPQAVVFTETDDPAERRLRRAVLDRLGARGLRLALGGCAPDLRTPNPGTPACDTPACDVPACEVRDPDLAAAARLTGVLRSASGIAALIAPIRAQAPVVAAARERRRRREAAVGAVRRGYPAGRDAVR